MLEVTLNTLVYSSDTVMQFYSPLRYHLENVSACLALGDAFLTPWSKEDTRLHSTTAL